MNSKPRIAYLLTPITFGGAERVSLNFLKEVNRETYEIYPILFTRLWEEKPFFAKELQKLNFGFYTIPVALKETGDPLRVLRAGYRTALLLKRLSVDLVHTHGYFVDIIGTPVCKFLGIPHLSTCHGFISNDRNLKIYNRLDRLVLRFCEKVICVSEEIKNDLFRNGIKKSKVIVIQNAVQNSYGEKELTDQRIEKRRFLSIEKDELVIGYVGRLSEEKGVRYLIEAGSVLKEKFGTFRIVIIGDGPKRKELEDLAKSKGLEKEIIFAGFQSDVEKMLAVLDVFALPSLTEGTPMALLEAMSAGIPPVASAVGGVPGVVEDGVNGFLVAPGDFRAISEKIMALKNNSELRKKMGMEAADLIKSRFNIHKWCRKIEEQYDLLLQKR